MSKTTGDMSTGISMRPANPAEHISEFEQSLARSATRGNWTEAPEDVSEAAQERLRSINTDRMVGEVTERIKALEARLTETRGYDPKTGLPVLVIAADDPRRRGWEMQLHHMKTNELRYVQSRAAHIKTQQAALPTPTQKLANEVARQDYIKSAAERRATEMEIEEAARRVLAQRRRSG